MLREFHATIFEEMDYVKEGRNADRFRYNFRTWRAVRVPKIFWSHTKTRVLTLEFIRGTKVVDLEGLRANGISAVKVNRLLIRTYLKQLLEDGFFHADPHPGNLLVMDSGHLAFFDFGMVGRISPKLQAQMIDAFFHVIGRDVHGLGQDIINLNFLKPGVDPETVRPVVESLFTHYLNLRLGEVNFKELTYDLAEVIYEYPFRLPSNFTYVMRALMTLEGYWCGNGPGFQLFRDGEALCAGVHAPARGTVVPEVDLRQVDRPRGHGQSDCLVEGLETDQDGREDVLGEVKLEFFSQRKGVILALSQSWTNRTGRILSCPSGLTRSR
jgi:predicted unusual protein kinase regulating ubiquinone biosynthesis (AarF/ABC1/UbiB family)